jgi:hypothetical protein
MNERTLNRRRFLRASGVCLALPMLETFAEADKQSTFNKKAPAKRLICIGSNLGYYRKAFYPKKAGRNYEASTLLSFTDKHRNDYTVFSGLDHRAGNGHVNWDNFLCGPRTGKISLDQIVTESIGEQTRIPSFQLCAGGLPSIQKVSFNRQGIPLPMTNYPSVVYKKLFSSAEDRKRTDYLLSSGKSSLDTVLDESKVLARKVSQADRDKLREYYNSVREVEKRMVRQRVYLKKKPIKVDYKLPGYDPVAPSLMLEAEDIMYDLMALAFQTDSTRVATMFLAGLGQVFTLDGTTLQAGYHALSHHGNDPEMIRDLVKVESEHMKCLNRFLNQLKDKKDAQGQALLDSTIVLFGTGMGDASTHNNSDLPTLVAGGGFKHGSHISNNRNNGKAHILGDLYITILNQLGIEASSFANAKRALEI